MLGAFDAMKTALITGSSKRVGRGLALGLAARGYAIAAHYHQSEDPAQALVDEIVSKGGTACAFGADLSSVSETENLIPSIVEALGPPDCLINNASIFEYDTVADFTSLLWDEHMNTNLRAPALLSRDLAAALAPGRTGCIINLLDQKVGNLNPEFFSYTISKFALEAVTKLMAMALAPRVRVCAVAPGLTLPSGTQTEKQFEESRAKLLLPDTSSVEAICQATFYLLNASSVTGQVIFVDGGERFQSVRDYNDTIKPKE